MAEPQLSAEGSFADAVQLAGKVARPEMGIVLQSVRFVPYASGVRLELEVRVIGEPLDAAGTGGGHVRP